MPDIITHSNSNLSRQALQQQAKRRRLTRLFRGAYVNTQEYAALTFAEQYRVRAEAFLATHAKLRAWGITAAALDGAPVLSGAPLHFGGARSHAKSKQAGCSFHEALLVAPSDSVAQTLFECAATSPLPDALLAANHLLRRSTEKAKGSLIASRDLDEKTTEALVWQPVSPQNSKASIRAALDVGTLRGDEPNFLTTYSAVRRTGFISPEAELAWLGFAQICALHKGKRGQRNRNAASDEHYAMGNRDLWRSAWLCARRAIYIRPRALRKTPALCSARFSSNRVHHWNRSSDMVDAGMYVYS